MIRSESLKEAFRLTSGSGTHRLLLVTLVVMVAFAQAGCESPVPATVDPPEYGEPAGHFLMYGEDVLRWGGSGTMHVYSIDNGDIKTYTEALEHLYAGFPFSIQDNGSFLRLTDGNGLNRGLLYYPHPLQESFTIPVEFGEWSADSETAHISEDGTEIWMFLRDGNGWGNKHRLVAINLQDFTVRDILSSLAPGLLYPRPGTNQWLVAHAARQYSSSPSMTLIDSSGQQLAAFNGVYFSERREQNDQQLWAPDGNRFGVLTQLYDMGWADMRELDIRSFTDDGPIFGSPIVWDRDSRAFYSSLIDVTTSSWTNIPVRYSSTSRSIERVAGEAALDMRPTALSVNGRYLALLQKGFTDFDLDSLRTFVYDLKLKRFADTLSGLRTFSAFR